MIIEEAELIIQAKNGSKKAIEKLINYKEKQIKQISSTVAKKDGYFEDYLQEGRIALLRAIERFDSSKGYELSTYANYFIKAAIQRFQIDKCHNIRLPYYFFSKVQKIKKKIADEEDVSLEEIDLLNLGQETLSLDSKLGDSDDSDIFLSKIASKEESPEETVFKNDIKEKISNALQKLPEIEADIIKSKYEIDGENKNLTDLSKEYGISQIRTNRKLIEALRKLSKMTELKDIYENL